MPLESTATRVWKRLTPAERKTAAESFYDQPPTEVLGAALGAIVKARHLRPQAARSLPPAEQARILAGVLDPGEPLAASLLVALHLKDRRPLLVAFLDAVGLPHQEGLLKEEADSLPAVTEDKARAGALALKAAFPVEQVRTYLNTLWLQDRERWSALAHSDDWLAT
jgi:hypothetical protein